MNTIINVFGWFWEILTDWPLGTIAGILVIVLAILLFALIIGGIYTAIDSWFLPHNKKIGRVIGKKFTPAHTQITLTFNAATKTTMPHSVFYPDDWVIKVNVDGKTGYSSVLERFYDSLSENDPLLVEYVIGRFSGNIYVKGLYDARNV